MGFRKLLEMSDKIAREELGNYYIISSDRMDNYIHCLEDGAAQIKHLTEEIERLRRKYEAAERLLKDIGDFAHERSTGPALQDDLWEVRRMAYQQ